MAKMVKGGRDGLVAHNNIVGKKTEPIVTTERLKATWLFGVKIRDKETGEDFADESYQNAIDTAISLIEHYLDVSIAPVRDFEEFKDYSLNDYQDFGYMQLNNFPVIGIKKTEMVYFRDEDGQPVVMQTIPLSWIRLHAHDGIVRMVPNTVPTSFGMGGGGYYPELMRHKYIPAAWKITYDYGFHDGQIPALLNQAISMVAAIICLITAGHLILGAGIAGSSISLDGLSQSIQTTQSAENSGFSSVIKDISEKLYGKTKDDPFAIMTILRNYYKGQSLHVF